MKLIRCINTDKVTKKCLKEGDIRINIRCIDNNDIRFLAEVIFGGTYLFSSLGSNPIEALDRAFYQLAGEECEDSNV